VLWGCNKNKQEFENAKPKTIFEKTSIDIDESSSPAGRVEEGVYYDSSDFFSIDIPEDWDVNIGVQYGGLHLRFDHIADEASIEVWSFHGVQYKPAPRDECIWSFLDKGLYMEWGFTRSVNIATCVPIDNEQRIIYAYIMHKHGRTWQLESHVSRENMVVGKQISDQVLRQINWNDASINQR